MTTNPRRPRHPGQDGRRDSRRARLKTDPDRALWCRLPACPATDAGWKPAPQKWS
jgi:hypothetical protein